MQRVFVIARNVFMHVIQSIADIYDRSNGLQFSIAFCILVFAIVCHYVNSFKLRLGNERKGFLTAQSFTCSRSKYQKNSSIVVDPVADHATIQIFTMQITFQKCTSDPYIDEKISLKWIRSPLFKVINRRKKII